MISGKFKSAFDKQSYGRLFVIYKSVLRRLDINQIIFAYGNVSLFVIMIILYFPFSILCPIYIRVFLPGYFSMATQRDPILIEIFDLDNNEVAREQRRKSQPHTQSGIVVNSLTRARRPSPFEINVKRIYKKYTSDFFFFVENDEIH